jgi:alpha/beta superfamily hydrolase
MVAGKEKPMMRFYIPAVVLLLIANSLFGGEPAELKTDTGILRGTLEVPKTPEHWPAILFIAGSGPTDRDGNNSIAGRNDSLKLLAEALAKRGIGSLRFDKRAIAESSQAGRKEEDLRFETYIDDAVQWGKQLLKDPRVRFLVVLGHSEGSLIGMETCKKLDAKGFISIAGSGRPASRLILSQLEPKLPAEMYQQCKSIIEQLEQGKTVAGTPAELNALFRPSVQPYLISWFKYDPAKRLAPLKIPCLIIQGTTDIQATVDDAKLLAKSNQQAKLVVIEGMNHIFKKVPNDLQQQIKSYNDPSLPVVPELVEKIAAFTKGLEKTQTRIRENR